MNSSLRLLSVFLVASSLVACGDTSSSPGVGSALRWPGAEWAQVDPASVGMDATLLDGARDYAFRPERNTQGVVVVKDGAIVAEWYAPNRDASSLGTSWSMGKSFGSTLVGIAIDQGLISGLDEPLSRFFPDWQGDPRGEIRLRDLLQMRSGLKWNEALDDAYFHAVELDQLGSSLARPLVREPGTFWNYSSADSMLMSGVIQSATGRTAGEFAKENLFGPIGMDADWWIDGSSHTMTYCCVDATPRDFARFGLLFGRGGSWNGREVVSRGWVDQATTPQDASPFYGLQWWTDISATVAGKPVRAFVARGLHTQNIYVFPELDLVVVRNGMYTRLGNGEPVRVGSNYLGTLGPATWEDDKFLEPILKSLDPTADASPFAAPAAFAASQMVDPMTPLAP
ncbi:MAG: serine hydrolase domain-containing protein [Alphaproteobacteria bacterium]